MSLGNNVIQRKEHKAGTKSTTVLMLALQLVGHNLSEFNVLHAESTNNKPVITVIKWRDVREVL